MLLSKRAIPETPKAFASVDEMFSIGLYMFQSRKMLCDVITEDSSETKEFSDLRRNERKWTAYWHRSLALSGPQVPLAARLLNTRLNRLEREIVLVLLMRHLALLNHNTESYEEVLDQIALTPSERVKAMRSLNAENRLIRYGLVEISDNDAPPPKRELLLDPILAEMAMNPDETPSSGWPVKTEEALYDYLSRLAHAFQQRADTMNDLDRGCGFKAEAYKWRRIIIHQMRGLNNTLKANPRWHLAEIREQILGSLPFQVREEWAIFLALLCKELGHVKVDDPLFHGIGLVRAATLRDTMPQQSLHRLESSASLRAERWIQPCGGSDVFLTDEPQDLEETEFELAPKSLEALGLTKKISRKRKPNYDLMQPRVRMNDLVLADRTQVFLKQAIVQARHFNVLFNDWGLGERIAYGRGVTMLFYGPPGTGKTAAAQALAHELEKPILVADYSKLQNCLVGQTEKNIVRIFCEARENDAVLFWDEADAMFFDRDSSTRNWEVRDVNVLLQELERFEGTCILATNRKTTLDKALERRISLKVGFERPDKAARREIFRRMLPKNLPLDADVDLDALASKDLSGGEIKNAILNAARNALVRGGSDAKVNMEDFMGAIAAARQGSWTQKTGRAIGFTTDD